MVLGEMQAQFGSFQPEVEGHPLEDTMFERHLKPHCVAASPFAAFSVGDFTVDAPGPYHPFISSVGAALQLHEIGHSCIAQHFFWSRGRQCGTFWTLTYTTIMIA